MFNGDFTQLDFDLLKQNAKSIRRARLRRFIAEHTWLLWVSGVTLIVAIWLTIALQMLAPIYLLLLGGGAMLYFYVQYVTKHLNDMYANFASKNNLGYTPTLSRNSSEDEGIIFGLGRNHQYRNKFTGRFEGKPARFFEYKFTIGHGKQQHTYRYQVMQVDLNKSLPYMLIDNKDNATTIPRHPSESMRVHLEGDFDQHFKMYSTVAETSDPLTIITPDVMQTLIKLKGNYDIEINNGTLTVFTIINRSLSEIFAEMTHVIQRMTISLRSNVKHYTAPVTATVRKRQDDASEIKKSNLPKIIYNTTIVGTVTVYLIMQFVNIDKQIEDALMPLLLVVFMIGFLAFAIREIKKNRNV